MPIKNPSLIFLQTLTAAGLYVGYLWVSGNIVLTYLLLPLLFLLRGISFKQKMIAIIAVSLLDIPLFYQYISPYEKTYLLAGSGLQKSGDVIWIFLAILISIFSVVIAFILSYLLSYLRSKRSIFVVLFYILLTTLLVCSRNWLVEIHSVGGFWGLALNGLIAKKAWFIFLLSYEAISLKALPLESLGSYLIPSANFRETLAISRYPQKLKPFDNVMIKTCLGAILGYVVIQQFDFFVNNNVKCYETVIPLEKTLCFVNKRIGLDLIKNIMLDTLIFFIFPLALGVKFSTPWGKFWKSSTWTNFLGSLFYFYSLIISVVFIQSIYKELYACGIRNRRLRIGISIFLGVWVGGICFHLLKDYVFVSEHHFPNILQSVLSFRFNLYFSLLALSCALVEIYKNKIPVYAHRIMIVCFLFLFIGLRSNFAAYFMK